MQRYDKESEPTLEENPRWSLTYKRCRRLTGPQLTELIRNGYPST